MLHNEHPEREHDEVVKRLNRDLRIAAETLSREEARFLVDGYYIIQATRIRSDHQIRALSENGEPSAVINWLADQSRTLEGQVRAALARYSDHTPICVWSQKVIGIGPVIAAGLAAHIDIEQCPTVSHIWSFAGLNPNAVWNAGEKRPWNADLKVLCWKLGKSFVLVSGNKDSLYGRLYRERKAYEVARNDSGGNAEAARESLATKNWSRDTVSKKALLQGKLPDGRIDLRARRYAVKLFLSHFHAKWRALEGLSVPVPYAIAHQGHAHHIEPEVP
jgi:hypothetical protein